MGYRSEMYTCQLLTCVQVKSAVQDAKTSVADVYHLLEAEDERAKKIRRRSTAENLNRLIRRVIGTILTVVIVLAAWVVISVLYILQSQVADSLSAVGALRTLVVPLSISLINAVAPKLAMLISRFEKWDDPAFELKVTTVRQYLLKIANVIVVMLAYMLLIINVNTPTGFDILTLEDGTYAEDQTGQALFIMVCTDFVTGRVGIVAGILVAKVFAKIKYATLANIIIIYCDFVSFHAIYLLSSCLSFCVC